MDPRPYHFEYRKPRLSNPTFQSNNLYDSMYQLKFDKLMPKNIPSNRYNNVENKKPLSEPDQVKRNQSLELQKPQKLQFIRYPSKHQIPTSKQKIPQTERAGSKLSNYGYNLMKAEPSSTERKNLRLDQTQIFQKQQHAFDIINYKPTQYRARLKMYPKLTLEDKLNERYGSPLKQNLK